MAQLSIPNPCDPTPSDPCRSPIYPLFNTGIAVRQIPLCSEGPFCECPVPSVARYRIDASGTLDRSNWIEGWIIGQLSTRAEVTCEEHSLQKRGGGWWADSFRRPVGQFISGSKLWALQWSFVTNEALIMAKQYASQALQYLLAWGIASSLKIETSYVSKQCMRLHITVIGPGLNTQTVIIDGQAMPNAGWLWAEYKP